MPAFLKIGQVFLLAMIKYFYAPIYGIAIGMQFWPVFFSLISGGTLAFLIYYHVSDILMLYGAYMGPVVSKVLPASWRMANVRRRTRRLTKRRNRKKFTRRNKIVIKFRRNYGMWGIILLTPVLISLPVGAFLLRKYYHETKMALPLMLISIVVEGFILCVIYWNLANI